ncbi:MAG: glycine cleavage system aminomethyltransferase GcvT [Clostridiaceae bacterium]|nr:glycine cleavage system aminomethyltransferase GcvT [Clostridiaceae bacterium]
MEKKTPIYDRHVELKGRMVPFAGYMLPVQYETGVITEHNAVRNTCGLFDVSHMGQIVIQGSDALENMNMLLTNSFTNMSDGRARYSPMCNPEGGTIDDLIVFRISKDKYLLGVNAANRDKDFDWIKGNVKGNVEVIDISDDIAQVALQGPNSYDILRKLTNNIPEKYYSFLENVAIDGINCFVSKTGYTGELGYEISCSKEDGVRLWNLLLDTGRDFGLIPCGLGARDTLRLEAGMPLYGHELSEDISPLEASLDFAVKMDKEDFIGKEGIRKKGANRRRVGLRITGRGIARENCDVFVDGKKVGLTTSGTHSPTLGYPIAMALVDKDHTETGTEVVVSVRGREIPAVICDLPFYTRVK